jgi:hypothetical protein
MILTFCPLVSLVCLADNKLAHQSRDSYLPHNYGVWWSNSCSGVEVAGAAIVAGLGQRLVGAIKPSQVIKEDEVKEILMH